MKESIKVKFIDFWPSFDIYRNKFIDALQTQRDVLVIPSESSQKPDLLFYSRCGIGQHYNYENCVKIFYTGENDVPNYNECDYSISFYDMDVDGRNIRYPLYALENYTDRLPSHSVERNEANENRGFCSLVMSNSSICDPRRIAVIDAVNTYSPIASGGAFRNNIGYRVKDKIEFISGYKFNLALENSKTKGYVTEKIADAFIANTVPIYWGSEAAKQDFNPDSFINVDDYASLDSFIRDLDRINNDRDRYLKMLNAPTRLSETIGAFDSHLADFLNKIADTPVIHRTAYGEMGMLTHRYAVVHPLTHHRSFIKASAFINHIVNRH